MDTITLNIDGQEISTPEGKTVLEAALEAGIYIPHLCHHPDLSPIGGCRLCIVEIEGREGFSSSCTTPAENGMVVKTGSEGIDNLRIKAMELMLAGHPPDCGTCNKYLNCELQSLKQYILKEEIDVRRRTKPFPTITTNPLFVHDFSRCVLCGRCVRACHELRGAGVLHYKKKGMEACIGTASGLPLAESGCRFCGACAEVCPTGAIMDKEELFRGKNRKSALVPCRYACPAEIDIPRYVRYVREKDYSAAVAVIREKAPFPGVLGYVCNHPCESVCRRGHVNQPISIRNLKRYAVEHDDRKLWRENASSKPSTDRRVAVVGSGPCGLTAAFYLAKQGHSVTVFEALPSPGGLLRYGIPEYRLPRHVLDSEIEDIVGMGVEIKTNTRIESFDKLFEDGFDAVLVAVGTHKGVRPPIPGADNEGVLLNIDFLREVNLGRKVTVGKTVTVLGGGNVAFDCARVARRLGAQKVHIACIECRTDMPAACDEIEGGEAEGIIVHPAMAFTKILSENGKITGVEFVEAKSFCFDENKRLQLEIVEGSETVIETDTVIFAIGQQPDLLESFGLESTESKLIETDPYTFGTSTEGVFAAGDAINGTGSVIQAIASGRKVAAAIDRFLEGSGNIDEKLVPVRKPQNWLGPAEGFASMTRRDESHVPSEERLPSFCTIVCSMGEEEACEESNRCLQCDLRLKISSVKFWGSY